MPPAGPALARDIHPPGTQSNQQPVTPRNYRRYNRKHLTRSPNLIHSRTRAFSFAWIVCCVLHFFTPQWALSLDANLAWALADCSADLLRTLSRALAHVLIDRQFIAAHNRQPRDTFFAAPPLPPPEDGDGGGFWGVPARAAAAVAAALEAAETVLRALLGVPAPRRAQRQLKIGPELVRWVGGSPLATLLLGNAVGLGWFFTPVRLDQCLLVRSEAPLKFHHATLFLFGFCACDGVSSSLASRHTSYY